MKIALDTSNPYIVIGYGGNKSHLNDMLRKLMDSEESKQLGQDESLPGIKIIETFEELQEYIIATGSIETIVIDSISDLETSELVGPRKILVSGPCNDIKALTEMLKSEMLESEKPIKFLPNGKKEKTWRHWQGNRR